MEDDRFHDQCGVFGVYGVTEAANLAYLGLHALQHRGQEATGIATAQDGKLQIHRGLGLVQDVFDEDRLRRLGGRCSIGHVRYATAGDSHIKNAQPLAVDYAHGSLAIAHNGNLTNGHTLRRELEAEGSIFSTSSDTEVVVHLVARSRQETFEDRIVDALSRVEGAFSMMLMSADALVAVRDPHGFRPLCMGLWKDAPVFASEPPAFELMGGQYLRDLEPGEMVIVDKSGVRSLFPFKKAESKMCIFEYVYFARPDAALGGTSVYEARKELGRQLAKEHPADVDVVVPVPDSGVPAALGYAEAAGVPFELGLIRSHYIGRTFIEPQQSIRNFGVRLKLHPVRAILKGKRIAVIDDSIVRGTTSQKLVRMFRDAGAREVHLRISSPPTKWPCFYGIDTPTRAELIASRLTPEEIANYVTADSLGYLSVEGLHAAVGGGGYCNACFSGDYPIAPPEGKSREQTLPLIREV